MAEEKVELAGVGQDEEGGNLANGVENGNSQAEDAEKSNPSEDVSAATEVVPEESYEADISSHAEPTSTQGFELAEDPTGAAQLENGNGDAEGLVKGILGSAPVVPPATADGEAAAPAEHPKVPTQHTFYLVRVPKPDLTDIFNEISEAEAKLEEKRKKSQAISAAMRLKQITRREVADNRKEHRNRSNSISDEVQRKYEEIKPMQEKVKKIREAGSEARNAGRGLAVTSVEELQQRLAEIEYRMQHESISLQEEKKLLRELQTLEKSRGEVEAHEARRSTVTDQQGHREGLQNQLKPLLVEVDALKQQRDAERKIADTFNTEVEALDRELDQLAKERHIAQEAQDAAYNKLKTLRAQSYGKEADHRQYRRDLYSALQLAATKEVAALQAFCNEQVEKMHAKWQDVQYRKTYIAANERSTLRRFQSYDTRRPGVDEDPAELMNAANKAAEAKGATEKGKAVPQANGDVAGKGNSKPAVAPKEVQPAADAPAAEPVVAPAVKKALGEKTRKAEAEAPVIESGFTLPVSKAEEEDPAVVKEKRREEALTKAKEAEERKRKLSEKAQARAAARAAKEAEEVAKKREKEKQRRDRKKAAAAATAADAEPAEAPAEETTEAEAGETAVVAPVKEEDGLSSRQRKRNAALRKKAGGDVAKVPLPQIIAKKGAGKGYNPWVYIAGFVALVIVAILGIMAISTPKKVKA